MSAKQSKSEVVTDTLVKNTAAVATTPNEKKPPNNNSPNPKNQKKKAQKRKMLENDPLREEVISVLSSCGEGEELQALCRALQPDNNLLHWVFNQVCVDLSTALSKQYGNNFYINPFGSSVCGLAFKNSDLDLYLDLPINKNNIPRVIRDMCGALRHKFNSLVPITHAKVPLLKCVHNGTNYHCDLSFTSSMGKFNSKILNFLIQFDYRIHPLMIVLKYWLRSHQLGGTGKITNYCLIMMLIYYLQQLDQPILPPLHFFQNKIPEYLVDGWNLAWNNSIENKTTNTMKVAQLLEGFFELYSKFPFSTSIICPLFARHYNREKFEKNVPTEFKRYIKYLKTNEAVPLNCKTPICVQDPFNLAHNVGTSCKINLFSQFRAQIIHGQTIFERLAAGLPSSRFLIQLFTESPHTGIIANPSEANQLISNPNKQSVLCKLLPIEFELSILRRYLALNRTDTVEPIDVHKLWTEKSTEFILHMIRDFLLFDVMERNDHLDDGSDDGASSAKSKSQKINGQRDIHDDVSYSKLYEVHGAYDVYKSRKSQKTTNANYIEAEKALSKKLFDSKSNPIDLNCILCLTTCEKYDFLYLLIRDIKVDKANHAMKNVFGNFTRVVRNHLKAYFLQFQIDHLSIKNSKNTEQK